MMKCSCQESHREPQEVSSHTIESSVWLKHTGSVTLEKRKKKEKTKQCLIIRTLRNDVIQLYRQEEIGWRAVGVKSMFSRQAGCRGTEVNLQCYWSVGNKWQRDHNLMWYKQKTVVCHVDDRKCRNVSAVPEHRPESSHSKLDCHTSSSTRKHIYIDDHHLGTNYLEIFKNVFDVKLSGFVFVRIKSMYICSYVQLSLLEIEPLLQKWWDKRTQREAKLRSGNHGDRLSYTTSVQDII